MDLNKIFEKLNKIYCINRNKRNKLTDANTIIDDHGITLLMFAVSQPDASIAKNLIQLGADVNAKTDSGFTVLHCACNNYKMVDLLINEGADCDATTNCGNTCLILACYNNKHEIIRRLLRENIKLDVRNIYGKTPLIAYMMGCGNKDTEILQILIDSSANVIFEKYNAGSTNEYNGKTAYEIYVMHKYNLLDDRYLSLLKGESRVAKVKSARFF